MKGTTKVLKITDEIAEEYIFSTGFTTLKNKKDLNKDYDTWLANRSAVADQVRMALDSVNTTGQLLSVWPEAEKFIPTDVLDFSTIQLPSVSFSSLNKAVGI